MTTNTRDIWAQIGAVAVLAVVLVIIVVAVNAGG